MHNMEHKFDRLFRPLVLTKRHLRAFVCRTCMRGKVPQSSSADDGKTPAARGRAGKPRNSGVSANRRTLWIW